MTAWEVESPGQKAASMETQDVVRALAEGNLGMYAKVRRVGESHWTPITQTQEFYALCAFVNQKFASNSKVLSMNGNVVISNDLQRLVGASARIRASQDFYSRVGFCAPIFDPQFPGIVSTTGKIFRLWDNFWVGSLLTPAQATTAEGSSFLLLPYAINTDSSRQEHELHSYDYPIPGDQKGNLAFAVPAGAIVLHRVRIPVSRDKGEGVHTLELRNTSRSDKVAKGALVASLTLGSVIYKGGHRGFSIPLRVVSPQAASAPPPTPAAPGRICVRCGNLNAPTARFCAKCGNNLG